MFRTKYAAIIFIIGFICILGCSKQQDDTNIVEEKEISKVKSWTKEFGTKGRDVAVAVVTDKTGDIYVTGYTENKVGLDEKNSYGNGDSFIVKYSSGGIKQWLKQEGTISATIVIDIAIDLNENIYIAGCTDGGLDGNDNSGGEDIFLAKYNSDGVKQWMRQLGTNLDDRAYGVVTDSSGNIYLTGSTKGELDGNINAGEADVVVIKYNPDGTKQWMRQFGTNKNDYGRKIACKNKDLYIVGCTEGRLDGNINTGDIDAFVAKYSTDGVKYWVRQFGTNAWDSAIDVVISKGEDIYITGYTCGGLDGNTYAGQEDKFAEEDIFIVKYNPNGVKQWTRQLGTPRMDWAAGIAIDIHDDIYVIGYTKGDLDGIIHTSADNIFLVKYNSEGIKQWTRLLGSGRTDFNDAHDVACDAQGYIYIVGSTDGELDGNTNAGGFDAFIIKYNSNGEKQ